MIGRSLAHYRVLSKLGVGGMGEVYRATDTKLGREVAIKVLPADVARDPERLARFEREARLLASLNHPNIAAMLAPGGERSSGWTVRGTRRPSPTTDARTPPPDSRLTAVRYSSAWQRRPPTSGAMRSRAEC